MHTPKQQSGAVLFVALIMLLLLTMLSVSAMNSTVLQERMTANSHEYALAFGASEAALRDGEIWLSSPLLIVKPEVDASCASAAPPCKAWVTPTTSGLLHLWDIDKTGASYYRDLDAPWWVSHGIPFGNVINRTLPTKTSPTPPRYLVEFIGFNNPTGTLVSESGYSTTYEYYYDVTGRGTARGTFAAIIVQSVYGRIF